jgi:CheY-like chemotaxis protein
MKKILIVDDVPGWIRFHKNNIEYLHLEDIQIETALSAKEALAKVEIELDSPYNVIFTDMQMEADFLPKLAGEWLIEQIQMFKEYSKAKIVIISASSSIDKIAKKYKVDYVSKYVVRNSDSEVYKQFLI